MTDVMRRFLTADGDWPEMGATVLQTLLIAFATIAAALTGMSLVRPDNPIVAKTARLVAINRPQRARLAVILTAIALVIAIGLRLSVSVLAHYYNERGAEFQHRERPDLSGARESYQRAARLLPGYAQAHYNLATVLEELLPEKAVEEYRLAITYESHFYPAYNNLARLYLLRGKDDDYDNALKLLGEAGELAPQNEDVQYSLNKNLGWANYALKNYVMAEVYLLRAIALRGQQSGAAAHCLLAYVLREQGKAGVADECFYCVTLEPGEKDVEARWVSDARECFFSPASMKAVASRESLQGHPMIELSTTPRELEGHTGGGAQRALVKGSMHYVGKEKDIWPHSLLRHLLFQCLIACLILGLPGGASGRVLGLQASPQPPAINGEAATTTGTQQSFGELETAKMKKAWVTQGASLPVHVRQVSYIMSVPQNPLGLIAEGQALLRQQTREGFIAALSKFKEAFALCQKNNNKMVMGAARFNEGIAMTRSENRVRP